jgi:hypothetical protein
MKITIRYEDDNWEDISVNGEIVAQSHVLYSEDAIRAIVAAMTEAEILTEEVKIEVKTEYTFEDEDL